MYYLWDHYKYVDNTYVEKWRFRRICMSHFRPEGTVFVRISDMARISASFGLFYVLWRYFEMRHFFNDVKVPKNAQDQCEFEYLFIF